MGLNRALLVVSALSVSLNANAALTSYTGAGGVGLVYSSVSDITWTQDANLFKTLYDADNTLIAKIASLTPSYYDHVLRIIDADDFSNYEQGRMSWWGAVAFVNYLNSINYGGSNLWRLPNSNFTVGPDNTSGNELGQLYYSELEALGYPGLNGSDWGILGNGWNGVNTSGIAGPFLNVASSTYWSGKEYLPNPDVIMAWVFTTYYGVQTFNYKDTQYYVWPVSPGQVAAVPLPATSWIMITGLLGFFGFKHPQKTKRR